LFKVNIKRGDEITTLNFPDAAIMIDILNSTLRAWGCEMFFDEGGEITHIGWTSEGGTKDYIQYTIVEDLTSPCEFYHYILMRKDVPDYQSGKAMAQANHGGTKMVMDGLDNLTHWADIRTWGSEGGGFGTCIVLQVNASEMRSAVAHATILGLHCGIVHDPSYPVFDGEKVQTIPLDTCAYVFGRHADCKPVVGKYSLLRDS
jgi:peptidyl-tRNA hydrolase